MAEQTKQFRVLFRGKIASKFTRQQAEVTLAKMLRASPESLTPIFAGEQKISFSKRPLDFQTAVKLKVKLLRLGLVTEIEPWQRAGGIDGADETARQTPPSHRSADNEAPRQEREAEADTERPAPEIPAAPPPPNRPAPSPTRQREAETPSDASTTPPAETPPAPATSAADEPPTAVEDTTDEPADTTVSATTSPEEPPVVIRLEEPLQGGNIIEHVSETPAADEPSTSETIFHEHPDFRPWWKRVLTLPGIFLMLLIAGLAGYGIYQFTVFTPPSAAVVVENHLATEDLTLIGLLDAGKLRTTARWLDVDGDDVAAIPEMKLFQDLGIDPDEDIRAIVVAQHNRQGKQPTTIVLLGEFDEEALRSALQTRYEAHSDDDQPDRLLFTVGDDGDCERDLGIRIDHNEIILSSADFIDVAYDMIHESFIGRPAMLKEWREFRRYHPVSFAIFDPAALSTGTRPVFDAILGGHDISSLSQIMLGIDTHRVLIGDALITVAAQATDEESLDKLASRLTETPPFARMTRPERASDTLRFAAPLSPRNLGLPALGQHSLLGLCNGLPR